MAGLGRASFAAPWLIQGFLGARRGPTFMIIIAVGFSWFLGRSRRLPNIVVLAGGLALGLLVLLLVSNRGNIYLGSDFEFSTDINAFVSEADAANEYIYGTGAFLTTMKNHDYYWGRRYAAQLLVRPVPRQLWPTKYEDFGVAELEFNAGTAKTGMFSWNATAGAAPGIIADLWLEFSWGVIPIMMGLGMVFGILWRKAVREGGPWAAQYTIAMALSLYFVMQTMEAVIFRTIIISAPLWLIWWRARTKSKLQRSMWRPHPADPLQPHINSIWYVPQPLCPQNVSFSPEYH